VSAALLCAVFGNDERHLDVLGDRTPSLARQGARPGETGRRAFDLPDDTVHRIVARDPAAIELLLQVAFDPLVRFAYGFVRASDVAEDIVQEVLIRLWDRGASLQVDMPLTPYLYAAVRNRALNALRARSAESRLKEHVERETVIAADWERFAPAGASPDQRVQWNELMASFDQAISALTERQRSAVLLRFEQGRTVPEIGRILEISTKAAEKLVSRGLLELRKRMGVLID
jgi:RNA polymerase sigma-70 factor (ECF subfamily)